MRVRFFPYLKPAFAFAVSIFGYTLGVQISKSRVFKQWYVNLYLLPVKVHFIFGKES